MDSRVPKIVLGPQLTPLPADNANLHYMIHNSAAKVKKKVRWLAVRLPESGRLWKSFGKTFLTVIPARARWRQSKQSLLLPRQGWNVYSPKLPIFLNSVGVKYLKTLTIAIDRNNNMPLLRSFLWFSGIWLQTSHS
jgi:hypothetical protein